jgi:hypothetical protein
VLEQAGDFGGMAQQIGQLVDHDERNRRGALGHRERGTQQWFPVVHRHRGRGQPAVCSDRRTEPSQSGRAPVLLDGGQVESAEPPGQVLEQKRLPVATPPRDDPDLELRIAAGDEPDQAGPLAVPVEHVRGLGDEFIDH